MSTTTIADPEVTVDRLRKALAEVGVFAAVYFNGNDEEEVSGSMLWISSVEAETLVAWQRALVICGIKTVCPPCMVALCGAGGSADCEGSGLCAP